MVEYESQKTGTYATSVGSEDMETPSEKMEGLARAISEQTGKTVVVQDKRLRPLAQCEIAGQQPDFIRSLFDANFALQSKISYRRMGESLAEVICAGGYPAALARSTPKRREIWYRDYITTLIQRDVQTIANIRNLDLLPKLLSLTASQTAHLFNATDLAAPFSVSRPTIREYLTVLEQIFLVEHLQPWHSNRLSRLIKTPKIHLADTGLACSLLGINSQTLWQEKALLGQLLAS